MPPQRQEASVSQAAKSWKKAGKGDREGQVLVMAQEKGQKLGNTLSSELKANCRGDRETSLTLHHQQGAKHHRLLVTLLKNLKGDITEECWRCIRLKCPAGSDTHLYTARILGECHLTSAL